MCVRAHVYMCVVRQHNDCYRPGIDGTGPHVRVKHGCAISDTSAGGITCSGGAPCSLLHLLLMRLWAHMPAPLNSRQWRLSRFNDACRCRRNRSPCIGSCGGYARRCWCPRSPCRCSSGGYACRCWRPRSPCRCSSGGYARRCWLPRSPCTCFCGGYARRCWRPAIFAGDPAAVVPADAGVPSIRGFSRPCVRAHATASARTCNGHAGHMVGDPNGIDVPCHLVKGVHCHRQLLPNRLWGGRMRKRPRRGLRRCRHIRTSSLYPARLTRHA